MEVRDDTNIIWALGANAWYHLTSPSDGYKDIFCIMEAKVKLWMFIDSQYGKILKGDSKVKLTSLQDLSQKV